MYSILLIVFFFMLWLPTVSSTFVMDAFPRDYLQSIFLENNQDFHWLLKVDKE